MTIRELTIEEFENFVNNSPIGCYHQTLNYAKLMGEYGQDYEFIGYVNEYEQIKVASIIIINKNKNFIYGYAPRGFILDYFNEELLKRFTQDLITYYKRKKICFIKLNPSIAIGEKDPTSGITTYNWNYQIRDILEQNGYEKLKDNIYFESILPRFQAVVSLHEFGFSSITKNCRNKVRKGIRNGLHLETAEQSGIDILQRFIARKKHTHEFYYKDYYNLFHKDNMIDLFLVSLNSEEFLLNARKKYEEELDKNYIYQKLLEKENTKKNINKKMESDRILSAYKHDIEIATELNKTKDKIYIAGALVIKYQNRIHFLISGYDTKFKYLDPNYFMHYSILDYYKENYDYAELNGITGDFTKDNPYYGLNQFKLEFKPKIYEYIGEYDLPIQKRKYERLRRSGTLAKTFNKTDIKVIHMKKQNQK